MYDRLILLEEPRDVVRPLSQYFVVSCRPEVDTLISFYGVVYIVTSFEEIGCGHTWIYVKKVEEVDTAPPWPNIWR